MNIAIIGGGNVGTLMAAEFAYKGHNVRIYTSKPERWSKAIDVYSAEEELLFSSRIGKVTDSLREALEGVEYIWITLPAFLFDKIANDMFPYVEKGQFIGIIPGSGGAEFGFRRLLQKGCILFGLQRVHSIARVKEYGKSVYMLGRKQKLYLAAIPSKENISISAVVEELFDIQCEALDNYLSVTLTPSNPILHTTRLYTLFKEYEQGKQYDYIPLFYEEWDDASSELLLKCDEEVQQLCKNMKEFDLSYVKSLKVHYESTTVQALTKKLRSIDSLKGLPTPTVGKEHQLIPDFSSRYFTADFPYGLEILHQIACFVDIFVPHMTKVLQWYYQLTQNPQKFQYSQYGIYDYQSFKNFYLR
ncbi:MAG: NAD(P)-binding domain-containing protein [Dorea sp.]|nr:NAD(P)-binding domain-containing protein [Dorea sp.]